MQEKQKERTEKNVKYNKTKNQNYQTGSQQIVNEKTIEREMIIDRNWLKLPKISLLPDVRLKTGGNENEMSFDTHD